MDIASLRAELGLSQEEFARAIGLTSKGQVSLLERGLQPASVPVALAIERLSDGRISAGSICPTVALIERTRAESAA